MAIKKWSEYKDTKNESLKTFSKKKSEQEVPVKPQGSHVSASSEYADEVNQNIIKQAVDKNTKQRERKYPTGKTAVVIKDESIYPPETKDRGAANMGEETNEVQIFGKLAKFPHGVKASKAFNWVYNLKDPKLSTKDIWYLMVEKQDNELQMIKYQKKQGVNLTKFVVDLKKYYIEKYKDNEKIVERISMITIGGDAEGNVSVIANIPNITVENKKLIHKITEDLVKLLG